MCQRLFASVVVLILCIAPSFSYSQAFSDSSGEIATITRIVPGAMRPDGLSSIGTFHRYHIASADYLPHALLVKTRSYIDAGKDGRGLLTGEIGAILRPYGVTTVRAPFPYYADDHIASADHYGLGRMYEVSFSAPGDVLNLCERLAALKEVEYAEPLFIRHTTGMPDDPRISEQYGLARVEAEAAWAVSQGDTSVTIAIVDSGVDWMHEDLAANIWTNPNEIPDNKIDDDGNGFVDDVRGWDFIGNLPVQLALLNQYLPDNDPGIPLDLGTKDGRYHGTHCAGVAGAVTNNAKGIAGMSYHTRLIPVKVGSDMIEGNIYRGYEAIMYAASLGADIISCSWGGGVYSQAEQDVIDQATAMGSLVVAAAGNDDLNTDNFKHYPSSYRNVLSVGATDNEDLSASFSNYGIGTSVFAPGVNILSTIGGSNRYDGTWSGTSMATPLVSGLAALLKSAHPDWTPGEIASQIRSTVDNVIVSDSLDRPQYFGRINARRALEMNRAGVDTAVVPGITIVDAGVDAPGGIITDNAEKALRLTLRNHLGPVRNLRVMVTPLGDEVTITNATATIDSLGHMSTADLDLNVSVGSSSVWFEGTADLLVRYEAEGYVDFDLVQIPYHFASENVFTLLVSGLPGKTDARAGHSPAQGVFWGVGEVPGLGGGFIRFFGTNYNYNFVSPQALTSIFAFDYLRAYTVSGSIVYSTINGGGGWRNTPVASITQSLKNVHFFSSDVGIILGSPLKGAWGIGTTADGGTTWSPIADPPAALANEELVETAVAWRDDYGWFGTSEGRVFRTSDRGAGWNVSEVKSGAAISHLSFITPEQGIAIYHDPDGAAGALTMAATTDGGITWQTDVVRMDALGIVPVHLASPGATGAHVMLGNDGRVMLSSDNGTTWITEASSKTNALISAGTTSYDGERIRVWSLGTSVGHLDIPYTASSTPVALVVPSGSLRVISIHPNPVAEHLTVAVSLGHRSDVVIELMNEVGQVVLRRNAGPFNVGESTLELDLASIPSGSYLCRVTAGGAAQGRIVTVRR